jgi:hypothetical protein
VGSLTGNAAVVIRFHCRLPKYNFKQNSLIALVSQQLLGDSFGDTDCYALHYF